MAYTATIRGEAHRVEVLETGPGQYVVRLGEREIPVDCLEPQPGLYSLLVEGRSLEVDFTLTDDHVALWIQGDHYDVDILDERRQKLAQKRGAGASGRQDLRSPMPGNVRKVCVSKGDLVAEGDVLLILEAMKMQNELRSPIHGRVTSLSAREGVAVAAGDPLIVIEPEQA